jgi:hypothetical protein
MRGEESGLGPEERKQIEDLFNIQHHHVHYSDSASLGVGDASGWIYGMLGWVADSYGPQGRFCAGIVRGVG